ncbi:prepilin-type N-terminal cleavage/methylation domain-containing protein [Patescibacteria group bacterium]
MTMVLKNRNGHGLVEVLVAIAILAIGGTAVVSLVLGAMQSSKIAGQRTQAVAFAREGIEAVHSVAKDAHNRLAVGTFGLDSDTGVWQLTTSEDQKGIFTREIIIESAYRDPQGNLAEVGVIDPTSFKVTGLVKWNYLDRPKEYSLVSYVVNWDYREFINDFSADFSIGSLAETKVTQIDDGEISLTEIGADQWSCLDGQGDCTEKGWIFDAPGAADTNEIYVSGTTAFLVREKSPSVEFVIVDVSDPANMTEISTLELLATANDLVVSGNYAYIASDSNSQDSNSTELLIIDISDLSQPTKVGSFNASGGVNAESVFVSGSRAYLGRQSSSADEFFVIDISNPANPTKISSMNLKNTNVYGITVLGSFAYLATSGNAQELAIIDLTNETSLSVVGQLDLPGNADASDLDLSNSIAYLTRDKSPQNEFYLINVSDPESPVLLGSVDLPDNANSVWVDGTVAYVGTDNNDQEIVIINVSDSAIPSVSGGYDAKGDVNGVIKANGLVYLGTAGDEAELEIIGSSQGEGADSGGGFAQSGQYYSVVIDALSEANWMSLEWSEDLLCSGSAVMVQVRSGQSDALLESALWQGPDGFDQDEDDYYSLAGKYLLPPDHNGNQFFQYRVLLSADGTCTPHFEDLVIQYIPY